jgi:hypothetical protein
VGQKNPSLFSKMHVAGAGRESDRACRRRSVKRTTCKHEWVQACDAVSSRSCMRFDTTNFCYVSGYEVLSLGYMYHVYSVEHTMAVLSLT